MTSIVLLILETQPLRNSIDKGCAKKAAGFAITSHT